jgi:hypothetical protein
MADPKGPKPPPPARWPLESTPAPKPSAPKAPTERPAGRVVHDSRGNAVWDWVKETGRFCIESTSAMLKRLEVPGLNMENEKDGELRVEDERDCGGGYDPYNQKTPPAKSKGKPPGRMSARKRRGGWRRRRYYFERSSLHAARRLRALTFS